MRILLADDAEENIMVIQAFLQKTPHILEFAQNGEEAVERATEGADSFDLILMDIQMPIMDGYEATRKIRAWEKAHGVKRIPIIALTGHATTGDDEKSTAAGFDFHLTKPVRRAKLLEAITRYADSDV